MGKYTTTVPANYELHVYPNGIRDFTDYDYLYMDMCVGGTIFVMNIQLIDLQD